MLKTFAEMLFSLLFPRRPFCLLCGGGISSGTHLLCPECYSSITPLKPPLCIKCGKPQAKSSECHDCTQDRHCYAEARSYGHYSGSLKRLIYEFKYRKNVEISELLGEMILKTFDLQPWPTFDYVVPVPLHPRRERERGFNQSLLLSSAVSRARGIPIYSGLMRVNDTEHQTLLDKACRRKNLEGAFRVKRENELKSKTLLLVDDVYTTGATADACATSLKSAGALEIFVLTAARG